MTLRPLIPKEQSDVGATFIGLLVPELMAQSYICVALRDIILPTLRSAGPLTRAWAVRGG